jgi:hypothetical protein
LAARAREHPHRTRTQVVAPSFDVELLLGSRRLFEVLVDVDHDVTDLALLAIAEAAATFRAGRLVQACEALLFLPPSSRNGSGISKLVSSEQQEHRMANQADRNICAVHLARQR